MNDFHKTDLNFEKTATGDIGTISGVENVKKRLYRRLITTKQTLINRPDYGVGIKNYIGRLNNLETQKKLYLDIIEQFSKDLSVSKVKSVSVSKGSNDADYLIVNIEVELIGKQVVKMQFNTQGL